MRLNREAILMRHIPTNFNVPGKEIFDLPEKVLQFGTGVLLRGLPDFYIDKANKLGVFNGRIVVVKSTGKSVDAFEMQDGLYTHHIKGVVNADVKDEYIINAAVSRVLSAQTHWDDILKCAENIGLQIIISNTTEIGITLKSDDDINAAPPESFPGKLLAFLYKRYKFFNGSDESGMVIIPTELIVDNGAKLKSIVLKLAAMNSLEEQFVSWLNNSNDFCNSLVDRIVPGALKIEDQQSFEKDYGFVDELTIMSEPYSLWAIETSSSKTKKLLSFYKVDESVIISADINKYRELKLRLLNGTHTFCCGLAFLAGFNVVSEAMQDLSFYKFLQRLLLDEIAPCIVDDNISKQEAHEFALKVIDRFSNIFIQHKWLSITMQYTAKMKMRNVPLLLAYFKKENKVPTHMAAGFAAYIAFMKAVNIKDNKYYGKRANVEYIIDDDKADYFYNLRNRTDEEDIVKTILSNEDLWGTNLSVLNGFTESVKHYLQEFTEKNFKTIVASFNTLSIKQ